MDWSLPKKTKQAKKRKNSQICTNIFQSSYVLCLVFRSRPWPLSFKQSSTIKKASLTRWISLPSSVVLSYGCGHSTLNILHSPLFIASKIELFIWGRLAAGQHSLLWKIDFHQVLEPPLIIVIVIIVVVIEVDVLSPGSGGPRSSVACTVSAARGLLLGGDEVYDGCNDSAVFGLTVVPVHRSGVTDLLLQQRIQLFLQTLWRGRLGTLVSQKWCKLIMDAQ